MQRIHDYGALFHSPVEMLFLLQLVVIYKKLLNSSGLFYFIFISSLNLFLNEIHIYNSLCIIGLEH